MTYNIALIFSSLILLIVFIGILLSMYLKNRKSKKNKSPSPSKRVMTKVLSIEPQNTSQNFATENSRRAIENLVKELSESSSINPYVRSRD